MKRSKFVDLPRFCKKQIRTVAPISIAATAVLSGCSESDNNSIVSISAHSAPEDVILVEDDGDCFNKSNMDWSSCQQAYQQAQAEAESTSPRYETIKQCETDFPESHCHRESHGHFSPFMTGFIVGSLLDSFDRRRYYHPVYLYKSPRGPQRVMSDGTPLVKGMGKLYQVPSKTTQTRQPQVTSTMSRGGFGAKASAKASWGKSVSSWNAKHSSRGG